jgi:hypothetical protein
MESRPVRFSASHGRLRVQWHYREGGDVLIVEGDQDRPPSISTMRHRLAELWKMTKM